MRHIITLPGLAEANRKLDLLLAGGVIVPPVDPDPDPPVIATISNTPDTTQLPPDDIQGMSDFVDMIDAILTAKGR